MLKQYSKILVAVDGSRESELAFKKAVEVAKRNEAELLISHIIDVRAFQSISSFDETLADEATAIAKETLNDYITYANEHGLENVSYSIEYGSPKPLLSKQLPEERKIDLIMMGATGLNAVERILIGSVSSYVSRHALCDVLIVRTDLDNRTLQQKKKEEE